MLLVVWQKGSYTKILIFNWGGSGMQETRHMNYYEK